MEKQSLNTLFGYFENKPWDDIDILQEIRNDKTGLLKKAYKLSCESHEGDLRQDGKLARSHPAKVVKILIYFDVFDVETLAAAMLHDAPEDRDEEAVKILEGYPDKVFFMVSDLTKLKGMSNRAYYVNIGRDLDNIVLKLADRLHNLRNMIKNLYINENFTKSRVKKQIIETREYIYPISRRLINSNHKYAESSLRIFHEIKIAIDIARLILKYSRNDIVKYQREKRQGRLFP